MRINSQYAPVVLVHFDGPANDDEFDSNLAALGQIVTGWNPYAAVIDARYVGQTSWRQRRRLAAWMRRHSDAVRDNTLGTAFVIGAPVIRTTFQAIMRLQPVPGPFEVCATMTDAVVWIGGRLRAANVALPLGLAGHTLVEIP